MWYDKIKQQQRGTLQRRTALQGDAQTRVSATMMHLLRTPPGVGSSCSGAGTSAHHTPSQSRCGGPSQAHKHTTNRAGKQRTASSSDRPASGTSASKAKAMGPHLISGADVLSSPSATMPGGRGAPSATQPRDVEAFRRKRQSLREAMEEAEQQRAAHARGTQQQRQDHHCHSQQPPSASGGGLLALASTATARESFSALCNGLSTTLDGRRGAAVSGISLHQSPQRPPSAPNLTGAHVLNAQAHMASASASAPLARSPFQSCGRAPNGSWRLARSHSMCDASGATTSAQHDGASYHLSLRPSGGAPKAAALRLERIPIGFGAAAVGGVGAGAVSAGSGSPSHVGGMSHYLAPRTAPASLGTSAAGHSASTFDLRLRQDLDLLSTRPHTADRPATDRHGRTASSFADGGAASDRLGTTRSQSLANMRAGGGCRPLEAAGASPHHSRETSGGAAAAVTPVDSASFAAYLRSAPGGGTREQNHRNLQCTTIDPRATAGSCSASEAESCGAAAWRPTLSACPHAQARCDHGQLGPPGEWAAIAGGELALPAHPGPATAGCGMEGSPSLQPEPVSTSQPPTPQHVVAGGAGTPSPSGGSTAPLGLCVVGRAPVEPPRFDVQSVPSYSASSTLPSTCHLTEVYATALATATDGTVEEQTPLNVAAAGADSSATAAAEARAAAVISNLASSQGDTQASKDALITRLRRCLARSPAHTAMGCSAAHACPAAAPQPPHTPSDSLAALAAASPSAVHSAAASLGSSAPSETAAAGGDGGSSSASLSPPVASRAAGKRAPAAIRVSGAFHPHLHSRLEKRRQQLATQQLRATASAADIAAAAWSSQCGGGGGGSGGGAAGSNGLAVPPLEEEARAAWRAARQRGNRAQPHFHHHLRQHLHQHLRHHTNGAHASSAEERAERPVSRGGRGGPGNAGYDATAHLISHCDAAAEGLMVRVTADDEMQPLAQMLDRLELAALYMWLGRNGEEAQRPMKRRAAAAASASPLA